LSRENGDFPSSAGWEAGASNEGHVRGQVFESVDDGHPKTGW
jgi:hypothetical protein